MIYDGIFVMQSTLWTTGAAIIAFHSLVFTSGRFTKSAEALLDLNLDCKLIINGSVSLYFMASLFFFVVATYFFEELSAPMRQLSWSFHNIINIMKNIGLAIGFYYTGKRKIDITIEQLEVIAKHSQK
jgi:hypothetical protein